MQNETKSDFLGLPSRLTSDEVFTISGIVRIFPMKNPWVYLPVPNEYSQRLKGYQIVGNLIPITVKINETQWDTSIAPMGKSDPKYTHFIPLKAIIRKTENIKVGDRITLSFNLR